MELDKLRLMTAPVSSKKTIENSYVDAIVREHVFPSGAFSIMLPKGWTVVWDQPDAVPHVDDPVVPLARCLPGAEGALGSADGIEIVIWAALLPREIHGADWLHTWIQSQGYQIIDARELMTQFGVMGDALVYRSQSGKTKLHRLFVIKDGDLIFLLDGRVDVKPGLDVQAFQEIVLLAMMRFKLLAASGQIYAEPFTNLTLQGDNTAISLMIPQGWESQEGKDAPLGGASQTVSNSLNGTTVGTMLVVLGNQSDLIEDIEEKTLAKLQNQGHSFQEPGTVILERVDDDSVRRVLRYDSDMVILLSAQIVLDKVPILLTLLTPSETTSFEAWAINRRAFDIALATMERV